MHIGRTYFVTGDVLQIQKEITRNHTGNMYLRTIIAQICLEIF